MKSFIAVVGYASVFSTIVSEAAMDQFHWGTIGGSFVWLAAIVISFIPIARTIVLSWALSAVMPWWGSIPVALGTSFLRWWFNNYDLRAENIRAGKERLRREVEEMKAERSPCE